MRVVQREEILIYKHAPKIVKPTTITTTKTTKRPNDKQKKKETTATQKTRDTEQKQRPLILSVSLSKVNLYCVIDQFEFNHVSIFF